MKQAVLGLVVERRGYGYDLIRRFNERFGAAWQLNHSTVYAALDKLVEQDLIVGIEPDSGPADPKRHRKITYEATPAGENSFFTWLTAPVGHLEPVRAQVFLKIGLARKHPLALIQVLDVQIAACAEVLAEHLSAYRLEVDGARAVSWEVAACWYIDDAVITRLQGDLAWLRRVRAGAEALREHGVVPLTQFAPRGPELPPGWR